MAKYDDASWHFEGEFPSDLGLEHACTHIGMFLGWAIDNHLQSQLFEEEFGNLLEKFRRREMTGTQILRASCDDKLTDDDLNDEGNAFAMEYYEKEVYFDDYDEFLGNTLPTLYHVEDTWENYELIKEKLDARFSKWKEKLDDDSN